MRTAGLSHLTLAVRDLERSLDFYQALLGMQLLARWPRGAYLLSGDLWVALIVDAHARALPLPDYTHFALSVAPEQFDALAARVAARAQIWKENTSEGASLYVLDPDGHKLELHGSTLIDRLRYASEQPWEGLELTAAARAMLDGRR